MDETLVCFGDEIKALDETGRVGGYLVRFGTATETDLTGDYFDAATDFGTATETAVYYHHGLDATLKARRLGRGTLRQDDAGVWMEAQLELRDEYERKLFEMIRAGKMGLSSGTAAHLVQRSPAGKAQHIDHWPLGLDASITPTPAEPRTSVVALKTLISETTDHDDEADAEAVVNTAAGVVEMAVAHIDNNEMKTGEMNMNENQVPAEQPAGPAADLAALTQEIAELKAALTATPAAKPFGIISRTGNADQTDEVKAFLHYARTGDRSGLKAALNEGTGSQGGYVVPTAYSSEVVQARNDASILRRAGARVISLGGNNSFKVPTLTNSTAAVLTAEAASFNEVEPTFGQVTFTPYKYTKLVKASDEILMDNNVNLMSIITQDAGVAFAAAENAAFTTGTGSSQPEGVVTGSSAGVTAASSSAITSDEVIDLYHSLGYLYRANAVWMMNDATLKVVRKLKDNNNQYLWQPSLASGAPETLLGRPVITNNSMATITNSAKVILFGDFSYFWIADWSQMEMKRLDELYAANGQVGFTWYSRFDSHVMLSAAIKRLTMAA